jgi:hypothetical protein
VSRGGTATDAERKTEESDSIQFVQVCSVARSPGKFVRRPLEHDFFVGVRLEPGEGRFQNVSRKAGPDLTATNGVPSINAHPELTPAADADAKSCTSTHKLHSPGKSGEMCPPIRKPVDSQNPASPHIELKASIGLLARTPNQ